MAQPGLQLEQAPPISVPFRFFLSAPIFLVLAAAVLLWRGPEVLESRFSPAALAITHLFTLGFMSMVMMGALMQLLPVLAGAPIAWPRTIAAVTHAGLCIGTLLLAAGFLSSAGWCYKLGAIVLAFAFAVFLAAVAVSLWRSSVRNSTTQVIRLAVLSLVVTIVFGIVLASSLGWSVGLPDAAVLSLHPAWGLLGWAGLLSIGVAFQVVPMFQLTPKYPALMTKYVSAAIFCVLILWSVSLWIDGGQWDVFGTFCGLVLAAAYVAFAVTTITLQQQRRRRQPDVTFDFWRVGMASLFAANGIWALCLVSTHAFPEPISVLIGLLALFGFAGSIISGMLYKIMPFLAWFHLQSVSSSSRLVPNMKKILAESDQRLQLGLHLVALVLLVIAVAWPSVLVYPAAIALGAAGVFLEINLLKVVNVVRRTSKTHELRSVEG